MFLALIDSPGPKPSSHAITNNGMNIKPRETHRYSRNVIGRFCIDIFNQSFMMLFDQIYSTKTGNVWVSFYFFYTGKVKTRTHISIFILTLVPVQYSVSAGDIYGHCDTRRGEERVNTEQESWVGGAELGRWKVSDPVISRHCLCLGLVCDNTAEYLHRRWDCSQVGTCN